MKIQSEVEKRYVNFLLFVCLALFPGVDIWGQQERKIEAWTGLRMEYDIQKRWEAELQVETRYDLGPARLSNILGEITMKYDLWDWLEVGTLYRYYVDENDETDGHRWGGEIRPSWNWGAWKWKTRLRYEVNVEKGEDKSRWRSKMDIEYQVRWLEFNVFGELFWRDVVHPRKRWGLGCEGEVSRRSKLGVVGMVDVRRKRDVLIIRAFYKYEWG